MTVDTIASPEALERERDAWGRLHASDPGAGPYTRLEWIASWWEGFGRPGALRVLAGRDSGALVAAFPLMTSRRTLLRMPVRALHTVGLEAGGLDVVTRGGEDGPVAAIVDAALDTRGVDVLIVKGPFEGTDRDRRFRDALRARGARFLLRAHREAFVPVAEGHAAYVEGRGAKFWRNVRNRRKRLEQEGRVTFERHRSLERNATIWDDVFDVSLRSWKGAAGSATGLQPPFRRYFAALGARFGATGSADVSLLRLDGTAIAYRIGFVHGSTFLECDIAYDKEYRAFSPGTLLAVSGNEALIGEGVTGLDLGLGLSWKDEWSPIARRRIEYLVFPRRSLYAALLGRLVAWRAGREPAAETIEWIQ